MKIWVLIPVLVGIIAAGVFYGIERSREVQLAAQQKERLEYRKQLQSEKFNTKPVDTSPIFKRYQK